MSKVILVLIVSCALATALALSIDLSVDVRHAGAAMLSDTEELVAS